MADITPTAAEIFDRDVVVPPQYRILNAPDVPTGLADALQEIAALREQRAVLFEMMRSQADEIARLRQVRVRTGKAEAIQ